VTRAYSDAVLDHVRSPRGAGGWPAGTPEVVVGEAGDEASGRLLRLELRGDARVVREARFRAFGCAATLACGSHLAERLPGLTREAARGLAADEISRALALPEDRRAAASLAIEALRRALDSLAEVVPG